MPLPLPHPLTATETGERDPFATLLRKRIVFGELLEIARSHHDSGSPLLPTLDRLVDALTDELETHFLDQWECEIDQVYAHEAAFLHLPYDPHDDTTAVFLRCSLCRQAATGPASSGSAMGKAELRDALASAARPGQPARKGSATAPAATGERVGHRSGRATSTGREAS